MHIVYYLGAPIAHPLDKAATWEKPAGRPCWWHATEVPENTINGHIDHGPGVSRHIPALSNELDLAERHPRRQQHQLCIHLRCAPCTGEAIKYRKQVNIGGDQTYVCLNNM
jgi:hypothetical protein